MGRGNFITISEAVEHANPGDSVIVTSGIYDEQLVVDISLEILGKKDADAVIIKQKGQSVFIFNAAVGTVKNITFQQLGGGMGYGIQIEKGRLVLENCDISSKSLSCIGISDEADPVITKNAS